MNADDLERSTLLVVDCWNRGDWPRYRSLTGSGYGYEDADTRRVGLDVVVAGSTIRRR